jgi:hypothetical protein
MSIFKLKFIYFFFISYLILGLYIYNDYGVGIEEHFQRKNGFYWLKELFIFLNLENLTFLALQKYESIILLDPSLPNTEFFNFYGIIFDVPTAFIELIFKIEDSKLYFEIRHLINFLFFFVGSIFFYKLIKNRFKNDLIVNFGTIFYVFNPRIFGDSFYNNKDVLFLSILTISIYYLFKYFEKSSLKSLILFCLFASFATSTRIVGIYLPILLIIFLFLEHVSNKIILKNFIKKTVLVIFYFIFFLYLHFPYIWDLNIFNLISWFKVFFYNMGLNILFEGKYYHIKYLPYSYLPKWIFITTPLIILLLSTAGFFFIFKRFIIRILNIKLTTQNFNDLWRSKNEKKDLFILVSLTSFFFFAVLLNVAMLSGWRHFYFLHIFIIYFAVYTLNFIFFQFKRKKMNIFLFSFVNSIFIFFIFFQIIVFHPYQSLYFNIFINSSNTVDFPVDTPSLSRADGLKFIVNDAKDLNKIFVATSSWTPLFNGADLLTNNDKKKLIFVGQEYKKANYIYTNFNYDVDPKLNKKYNIPSNFRKIRHVIIKGIPIYSIYKKTN